MGTSVLTMSWETWPGAWTWRRIPALPSSDFPSEPQCVHVRHEKCYFVTFESVKVCEARFPFPMFFIRTRGPVA